MTKRLAKKYADKYRRLTSTDIPHQLHFLLFYNWMENPRVARLFIEAMDHRHKYDMRKRNERPHS